MVLIYSIIAYLIRKRICKVLGFDPSEVKKNHFGGFDDLVLPTEENLENIKSEVEIFSCYL
jgi:hypothetical protein